MATLDIFANDAFSVVSMTEAINNVPFVPGRAGTVIPWNEEGVRTTTVGIESQGGVLALVNPSPRGAPGDTFAKDRRNMRPLAVPHYQIDDAIYADEVQNVRAFGSDSELESVQAVVNARQNNLVQLKLDPTLEYQRVGAVKGIILNGDGTTLYNLFTEFGVAQIGEIDFDLDNASPVAGVLRRAVAGVVRSIANELGGVPYLGIHAFCGDAFFDDLLAHVEVRNSYLNTPMAQVLRDPYIYPNGLKIYGAFEFGGVTWENYRGSVGSTAFINTDKCHIFPIGSPGLFKTVYAPADYLETVNTLGLPRYSKQYEMHNGKGVHLDVQMNALSYCTRPRVLLKGKRT